MESKLNHYSGLMPIPTIRGIEFVEFLLIIRIESKDRYTLVYIKNEENYIKSTLCISEFEKLLPTTLFFRCHRSHIIGLNHLKKMEKCSRKIQLTNNHMISIAEDRVFNFLECIDMNYRRDKDEIFYLI